MSFTYTRAQLKSDIDRGIFGKIGMISNQNDFVNAVVRNVNNDIAIRSTRRKQTLSPDLFNGIYEYACPTDLSQQRIIDIPAQAKRYDDEFSLVPVEQFNRDPRFGEYAIDDFNGVRKLLIKSRVDSDSITIDPVTSTTNWTVVGDAENITNDGVDYITGTSSLSFDIGSGGGTTAGLENTSITSFDITDYLGGHSAVFAWVKINNTTNLTNYILKIGSSNSNYYSKTVTTQHDGTAFESGWNLLRFDLSSLTETGTVDKTTITYASVYMTKDAAKVSETDYKLNGLFLKRGVIHDILYYSSYGWQNTSGTYLKNSTDDADLLVADQNEYDLFVKRGIWEGKMETNFDISEVNRAQDYYQQAINGYGMQNPDESAITVSSYHEE